MDVISLAVWGASASWGLTAGLMRVWIPLLFLLAGMGFAGGLASLVGPGVFGFTDGESGQVVTGFFLVFGLMLLLGAVITYAIRGPLTIMTALMVVFPSGALFNRFGGLLAGTIFGCAFLSLVLIGFQQYPVNVVGRAIGESSFASKTLGWVDQYVATLEFSAEWEDFDD